MNLSRIGLCAWKQLQRTIVGCLALLALTSPSDAKSFLQTLFAPAKVQTRATSAALPPFLQAFFGLFHQPQQSVRRRGRLRPAIAVRRMPRRVAAGNASAPFLTPAVLEPEPVRPDEGIAAAFLRDPTLRKGDIVVFPDGPRVFTGRTLGAPHQTTDFEDLATSSLVGEKTRRDVMAATKPASPDEPTASFVAKPSYRRKRIAEGR